MEWVAISFSRGLPNPRIEPGSPTLQADSLPSEAPGKPGREQGLQIEQENKIGHELINVGVGDEFMRVHHTGNFCLHLEDSDAGKD